VSVARDLAHDDERDAAFARWAAGNGRIRHTPATRARVRAMVDALAAGGVRGDGEPVFEVLAAADRIASAGMWLVVHETCTRDLPRGPSAS